MLAKTLSLPALRWYRPSSRSSQANGSVGGSGIALALMVLGSLLFSFSVGLKETATTTRFQTDTVPVPQHVHSTSCKVPGRQLTVGCFFFLDYLYEQPDLLVPMLKLVNKSPAKTLQRFLESRLCDTTAWRLMDGLASGKRA